MTTVIWGCSLKLRERSDVSENHGQPLTSFNFVLQLHELAKRGNSGSASYKKWDLFLLTRGSALCNV